MTRNLLSQPSPRTGGGFATDPNRGDGHGAHLPIFIVKTKRSSPGQPMNNAQLACCQGCGGKLPINPGQGRPRATCSDTCRRLVRARRAVASRPPKGLCQWCHRWPIPPTRGASRYCSVDCRTAARSQLHRHANLDRTELTRCRVCGLVCAGPGRPAPLCRDCKPRRGAARSELSVGACPRAAETTIRPRSVGS